VIAKAAGALALLALLVAGCGGGGGGSSSAASTGSTPAKAPNVGLVTDIGQLNDRGFNHLAYVGLQEAQKELGITYRIFQSQSSADYIPNLSTFAGKHYDLVIAVGVTETDAMNAVSQKFPQSKFAIVDVANSDMKSHPKNVVGLLFREQEVGYLAGYLAALEAKRLGKHVVGSIGGQKQPPVDRYIAGYQAGAKAAVPGITTLNGYSQDFVDQAKCKQLALNQIRRGAAVVFQVAGGCGLGVLDAAKEEHVWGIGVDADQSYLGPQVLTSAEKKVDRAVFLTIKEVKDGTFKGGVDKIFGLKVGGVGLGKISPKVPAAEVAKIRQIQRQIVSGQLTGIPTAVH
jgi:basic membrane protein A and related proteins